MSVIHLSIVLLCLIQLAKAMETKDFDVTQEDKTRFEKVSTPIKKYVHEKNNTTKPTTPDNISLELGINYSAIIKKYNNKGKEQLEYRFIKYATQNTQSDITKKAIKDVTEIETPTHIVAFSNSHSVTITPFENGNIQYNFQQIEKNKPCTIC